MTDKKQTKYLKFVDIIEEVDTLSTIARIVYIICFLVTAAIIWMHFAIIEEVANAPGQVIPNGKILTIQHLEGGIISEVLAKDGEQVAEGQPLLKLMPTATIASLDQMKARELALKLNIARLNKIVSSLPIIETTPLPTLDVPTTTPLTTPTATTDSTPATANHSAATAPPTTADQSQPEANISVSANLNTDFNVLENKEISELIQTGKDLLDYQYKTYQAQKNILLSKLTQYTEEIHGIDKQIAVQQEHLDLLNEEDVMYQQLLEQQAGYHREYLSLKREINSARGEYLELTSRKTTNLELINEVKFKIRELETQLYTTSLEKLNTLNGELLEVQSVIKKITDQVERLTVRAPSAGIIKGTTAVIGKVALPGEVLMEIVPSKLKMQVECKILPKDIGAVMIGDNVLVKVSAYDFAQYGGIDGHLASISASTFFDEKNSPYYKGIIELKAQHIQAKGNSFPLIPGMVVDVNIITGKKTLLVYILKPIRLLFTTSFRER